VQETIAVALETHVKVRDPMAAALHLPNVMFSERRVRARVDELIETVGLSAFRDKFIHELSTGSRGSRPACVPLRADVRCSTSLEQDRRGRSAPLRRVRDARRDAARHRARPPA
jgi:hypothetical protein